MHKLSILIKISLTISLLLNVIAKADDAESKTSIRFNFSKKLDFINCKTTDQKKSKVDKIKLQNDFFNKIVSLKEESKKVVNSMSEEAYENAQLDLDNDIVLITTLWPENIQDKDISWKIHEDCAARFWKIQSDKNRQSAIKSFKICVGGQHPKELPQILQNLIKCLE